MQRRLDTAELAFYEASRRAVTNCVIAAHLDRAPDPDRLRRAVDRVQARHPLLRARVVPGDVPRLAGDAPSIPLAVTLRESSDTWLAQVARDLNTPFPFADGPLCRFALVARDDDPAELVLSFSHMIGDGFSGAAIFRDLLTALQDPDRPLPPLSPRPALAEQLASLGRLGDFLDLAADSLTIGARVLGLGNSALPRPPADLVHHVTSHTFDAATTQRILAASRAEDTTVYGLLCATLLREIARHRRTTAKIALATPINIRPLFTPPVEDDVGVYAYAPSQTFTARPDAPRGPLAREVAAAVQRARRTFLPRAAGLSMRALRPWLSGLSDSPLTAVLKRPLSAEVVASNVGRIPEFAAAAGLKITNLSMFAMIPDIDMVMVSQSYTDRLTLNFIHTRPTPRPGLAEAARDGVLTALSRPQL
jgi:hypothetical protein